MAGFKTRLKVDFIEEFSLVENVESLMTFPLQSRTNVFAKNVFSSGNASNAGKSVIWKQVK